MKIKTTTIYAHRPRPTDVYFRQRIASLRILTPKRSNDRRRFPLFPYVRWQWQCVNVCICQLSPLAFDTRCASILSGHHVTPVSALCVLLKVRKRQCHVPSQPRHAHGHFTCPVCTLLPLFSFTKQTIFVNILNVPICLYFVR